MGTKFSGVDSLNFTWLAAKRRFLLSFEVNRRKLPWPNWRYYSSMSLGKILTYKSKALPPGPA